MTQSEHQTEADQLAEKLESSTPANKEEEREDEEEYLKGLDRDKTQREHDREQDARDIVNESVRKIIQVISYVIIISIAAVAWHFILPEWLGWLTEYQLSSLLKFLLSSIVVSSVSSFYRHYLTPT